MDSQYSNPELKTLVDDIENDSVDMLRNMKKSCDGNQLAAKRARVSSIKVAKKLMTYRQKTIEQKKMLKGKKCK